MCACLFVDKHLSKGRGCVAASVHAGIYVMTLYDVIGFNNTVSPRVREEGCAT